MYTIMFWNKYNEALIINEPYTSKLNFWHLSRSMGSRKRHSY